LLHENELERFFRPQVFQFKRQFKVVMDQIFRYKRMAELVRGSRKLDILMAALRLPARFHAEARVFLRMLQDIHHPQHEQVDRWLATSEYRGSGVRLRQDIERHLQTLEGQRNQLLALVEKLIGFSLAQDNGHVDFSQSWYSLGQPLPHGQDLARSFARSEWTDQAIKRLTFSMARVAWNAGYLASKMNSILVADMTEAECFSALCRLFFAVQERIKSSTGPDSEVVRAIESDRSLGMLSDSEYRAAGEWRKTNLFALQELMLDLSDHLKRMAASQPRLALPEAIMQCIKEASESPEDGSSSEEGMEALAHRLTSIQARLGGGDALVWHDLLALSRDLEKRMEVRNSANFALLERLRSESDSYVAYERQCFGLLAEEQSLKELTSAVDASWLTLYGEQRFADVEEPAIQQALACHQRMMLRSLQQLSYEPIDAGLLRQRFDSILVGHHAEIVRRLDILLQELRAIPGFDALSAALNDWGEDLKEDELLEKRQWLKANDEQLTALIHDICDELKEHFGKGSIQPRRLRFEVFGLTEYDAALLKNNLIALRSLFPRVGGKGDVDQLSQGLCALEAQVVMAQKMTKTQGFAYKKLNKMMENELLDRSLLGRLQGDLQENWKALDRLLVEITAEQEELTRLNRRLGEQEGRQHLQLTINVDDIERLREIYEFLDAVSIPEIKRFCVAYNTRTAMLEALFDKKSEAHKNLPEALKKQMTRKVIKGFQQENKIPLPLYIPLLLTLKPLFESTAHFLCYTLNFVRPGSVQDKAVVALTISVCERLRMADAQEKRAIGLLWGRLQSVLMGFHPETQEKNYLSNRDILFRAVQPVVDAHRP
jgi:hypothetical protein